MGSAPPCGEIPDHHWRLAHTAGWAFVVGASCGGAFHFCRALIRGSPRGTGLRRRLAAGAQAVRAHAPRVAGSCGAYLALGCAFESAASLARRKDDRWNSVAATGATWATLDARQGARVAARSAVLGAACGALLEGASIALNRCYVMAEPRYLPPQDDPSRTPPPGHAPTTTRGFLGIPRQTIVVEEIPVDDLPSL